MKLIRIIGIICMIVSAILLLADYDEDNNLLQYSLIVILIKIIGLGIGYIGITIAFKRKET